MVNHTQQKGTQMSDEAQQLRYNWNAVVAAVSFLTDEPAIDGPISGNGFTVTRNGDGFCIDIERIGGEPEQPVPATDPETPSPAPVVAETPAETPVPAEPSETTTATATAETPAETPTGTPPPATAETPTGQ